MSKLGKELKLGLQEAIDITKAEVTGRFIDGDDCYDTMEEMLDAWNDEDNERRAKMTPAQRKAEDKKEALRKAKEKADKKKRDAKYNKQRQTRGFADSDCWSIDYYMNLYFPKLLDAHIKAIKKVPNDFRFVIKKGKLFVNENKVSTLEQYKTVIKYMRGLFETYITDDMDSKECPELPVAEFRYANFIDMWDCGYNEYRVDRALETFIVIFPYLFDPELKYDKKAKRNKYGYTKQDIQYPGNWFTAIMPKMIFKMADGLMGCHPDLNYKPLLLNKGKDCKIVKTSDEVSESENKLVLGKLADMIKKIKTPVDAINTLTIYKDIFSTLWN